MSTLTKQFALLRETAEMAFDTLRANKMRSALTVLGVVIGVTSIVGMTSLIRGFDTSLRNSINSLGPNTIFVQRFGGLSFSSGASFIELMRRPLITADDMHAIERQATTIGMVDIWIGGGGPGSPSMERMFYRGQRTRPAPIMGTTEQYVEINFAKMHAGRSFTEQEVARAPQRRRDRLRPVRGAVRAARHRSDRQADPHRRRRVHGARRGRQAAVAGRRDEPRAGRLRDHSLHGVSQAVRQRESASRARSAASWRWSPCCPRRACRATRRCARSKRSCASATA